MSAQAQVSPKASAFGGGASLRLWEILIQDLIPPGSAKQPDQLSLSMLGRCLVPDGFHFVCEAVALTPQGLKITCEGQADPGDALVTNFRGLGEISGVVDSRGDGWFVMDIRETPERLTALSKRFLWSLRLQSGEAAERRMSVRFDQKRRRATLKTLDGREVAGELIDVSATGAAVQLGATAPFFWLGQEISLDGRSGRVRRHFAGGVGVEFDEAREVEICDESLRLAS